MSSKKAEPLTVELLDVQKSYGEQFSLGRINLRVEAGEFFCLLGLSGCGKSTILGLVGGWVSPDGGRVILGGKDCTEQPTYSRPIRAVLQKGGFLFPHMTAEQNIGFALRIQRSPTATVRTRVDELVRLLKLEGLEKRKPLTLSGGEYQRVAIARALADPKPILLMDEISTGLDRHLRISICDLLAELSTTLRVTIVFVTHDAQEAMSLASRQKSRIGVLHAGQLVQVGSPNKLYDEPTCSFVASLLGDLNLLSVRGVSGSKLVTVGGTALETGCSVANGNVRYAAIRPESVKVQSAEKGSNTLAGIVERLEFVGSVLRVRIRINQDSLLAVVDRSSNDLVVGREVSCSIQPAAVRPLQS